MTIKIDGLDSKADLKEVLGEVFHTALRKAADSPESDTAWKAIRDMKPDEWDGILDFVVDCLDVRKVKS
jgi:hypothetical protein